MNGGAHISAGSGDRNRRLLLVRGRHHYGPNTRWSSAQMLITKIDGFF